MLNERYNCNMIGTKTLQEKFDAGVSPVIGVILMVAITVILAAVIGTFVLDLGDDLDQDAQAAVTFDEDPGETLAVQLDNVQSGDEFEIREDGTEVATLEEVGDREELDIGDGEDLEEGDTVTVVGILDSNETVIQTYELADTE